MSGRLALQGNALHRRVLRGLQRRRHGLQLELPERGLHLPVTRPLPTLLVFDPAEEDQYDALLAHLAECGPRHAEDTRTNGLLARWGDISWVCSRMLPRVMDSPTRGR